jgi:hypothetical protein
VKILIYSYNYNWRFGGIVVLHKLADLIAQLGYETYVLSEDSLKSGGTSTQINQEFALRIANDSDTVVVYPEIVKGNPLKAKNVARWVLYFPGFHGGDKTYDANEYIFTFNQEFVADTIYSSVQVIKIIDTMVDNFFDMGLDRNKDAILIKKGRENLEERETQYLTPSIDHLYDLISADEVIKKSQNVSDFNRELNRFRYFISYDHHTYHNVLAALAGCVSIVIPTNKKSEDDFFLENPWRRNYVSYGFQNSYQSQTDQRLLRAELNKIDSSSILNAEKLVKLLQSHFKL